MRRWRLERGHHGVPDQLGEVPAGSLHAVQLRFAHLGREGVPCADIRGGDHQFLFRTSAHDGEVHG